MSHAITIACAPSVLLFTPVGVRVRVLPTGAVECVSCQNLVQLDETHSCRSTAEHLLESA